MVNGRQGGRIVCVTRGLGLLVIGDVDSLAPWRPDHQKTAGSKKQNPGKRTMFLCTGLLSLILLSGCGGEEQPSNYSGRLVLSVRGGC